MELYQIGRFLDLDILSQNCEDAIVQRLNHSNIAEVCSQVLKNMFQLFVAIQQQFDKLENTHD